MDTKTTQQETVPDSGITRTSINIATDLWDRLKVKAIHEKLTAGEAVEEAVSAWVGETDTPKSRKRAS